MKKIQLLVPAMPTADDLLPYLREIDRDLWYTNFGPLNARFEARILEDVAPRLGRENIATVSNCTVGLELALQSCGVGAGARILVPSLTFVATATAVVRAGMSPVFADVDERSWCLTPEIAARAAASIDVVMPVSTFGVAQDMRAWDEFAERYGKPVIVDAAGAYGNQCAGARADVVFSFHATKSFGIGEGGCVISPSAERISRIRKLENFGINTRLGLLEDLGTNGKLSEYHCAVGLAMFDGWEQVKARRRQLLVDYLEALEELCPGLQFQHRPPHGVYPLFTALLPPGCDAGAVSTELAARGIETRRWYCPPLSRHPALHTYPTASDLVTTERLGNRIIGLPFHLQLTVEDISRVAIELHRAITLTIDKPSCV